MTIRVGLIYWWANEYKGGSHFSRDKDSCHLEVTQ